MHLPRTWISLALVAACGGDRPAPPPTTPVAVIAASRQCPVGELEPDIVVSEHPDGATLAVTTQGLPQRLRARVFELADTFNEQTFASTTHAARARPEEIPRGAQIVFVADAAPVETVREDVRQRADEIAALCEYP